MKRLRLVIVGFGWWGQHMLRQLSASPVANPLAVVETSPAGQQRVNGTGARLMTWEEALASPEIDGVILTIPNSLHEEYSVQAARAGKHVFCEKPLSLTAASAARIVHACAEHGVALGVGHERRFEPAMQRVAALVRQGELGTVMHAEAAFSHDKLIGVPAGDWRTRKDTAPAAGMTATGIHLTDLLIWMFQRVAEVSAVTAAHKLDWETGDSLTAQLRFRSGVSATIQALLYTPHFIRFHVFGHAAHVEVRNATHPDTPGGVAELVLTRTGYPLVIERYGWTDTVTANIEAWARMIGEGAEYVNRPDEMLHNIEVFEAIAAAAERHETVHLPS